jgi:hypothetical protein
VRLLMFEKVADGNELSPIYLIPDNELLLF